MPASASRSPSLSVAGALRRTRARRASRGVPGAGTVRQRSTPQWRMAIHAMAAVAVISITEKYT